MLRNARWILALLLLATPAHADGTISLTWDGCVGPVVKSLAPGDKISLYASVIGQTALYEAHAVDVMVATSCPGSVAGGGGLGPLPDAWRFENGGCQNPSSTSPYLTIDQYPPPELAATCPAFQQGSEPSVQVKGFTYDAATGMGRLRCWSAYPSHPIASVNPATRYHLARFVIDQTKGGVGPSVPGSTCGGLETPLCLSLGYIAWLDLQGSEFGWTIGNQCVTVNDPTNSTKCAGATAVRAATWGSLKAQYR